MLTNTTLAAAIRNRSQDTEYLLNDSFGTNLAAGSLEGRSADPGPGRIAYVLDGNSKLSLNGGQALLAAGGVGQGNPQMIYELVGRALGRLVTAQVTATTETFALGFDGETASPVTAGTAAWGIRFAGSSRTLQVYAAASPVSVGNWAAATAYKIAIIARPAGAFYFIKGGAFTNWTLLLVVGAGSNNALPGLYPAIVSDSNTSVAAADYIRTPRMPVMIAPVMSDGFGAWGSSDGLGHPEGVAGIYGAGGNGKAWSSNIGTWGASGGVAAASALTSGRAIATADCGKSDIIISADVGYSSGTQSIIVRWVDENNHIQLRRSAANVALVKVVAGVTTTVLNTAPSLVATAPLLLVCQGDKFRGFYNGASIGAEQTISDAALQSPTVVGLRTDAVANTFDNLIVYARGTGGEYAELDNY